MDNSVPRAGLPAEFKDVGLLKKRCEEFGRVEACRLLKGKRGNSKGANDEKLFNMHAEVDFAMADVFVTSCFVFKFLASSFRDDARCASSSQGCLKIFLTFGAD